MKLVRRIGFRARRAQRKELGGTLIGPLQPLGEPPAGLEWVPSASPQPTLLNAAIRISDSVWTSRRGSSEHPVKACRKGRNGNSMADNQRQQGIEVVPLAVRPENRLSKNEVSMGQSDLKIE